MIGIRITGTPDECDCVVYDICEHYDVISITKIYPDSGQGQGSAYMGAAFYDGKDGEL